MFLFTFTPFVTIPHLVIEFLSSFCLRTSNFNDANPYYSMRFKLGGISYFLTKKEFDTLFGFKSEGEIVITPFGLLPLFGYKTSNQMLPNSKPNTLNLSLFLLNLYGIFIGSSLIPSMLEV